MEQKKNRNLNISLHSAMGFALIGLVSTAISSCAGHYRRPESFEAKMARFKPRNSNPNKVPKIQLDPSLPKTFRAPASRGPASTANRPLKKLPSNKRLYFMSLYGQYRALSSYVQTEQAPDIKHCASFHTTLVNYQEGLPPVKTTNVSFEERYKELRPDMLASYPELSLPMTLDGERPRLYDVLQDKKGKSTTHYVTQALKVHLTKTYKELEELCESGSSDNYYNYENLTTHIQREGSEFGPNQESLKILLRTTLFSNMSLLEGLKKGQGRMPASSSHEENVYQDGLIQKLGVQWTHSYYKSLRK